MKKYEDAVKGMFDDIELPAYNELTNDSATPVENKQGSGNKIPPEDFKYLEKTLQIQRNFTAINKKYNELLKKYISIENKLDGYKDMQVSLSSVDVAILRELPKSLSTAVIRQINNAANKIKEDITSHADTTMKGLDNACEAKIAATKKEKGTDKGIYLSWWNFWAMATLTLYSCAYAMYAAFNECLWNEVFERIWLPFLMIVSIPSILAFLFWLNDKEYKIPKL